LPAWLGGEKQRRRRRGSSGSGRNLTRAAASLLAMWTAFWSATEIAKEEAGL
jgi:hypothetical protein